MYFSQVCCIRVLRIGTLLGKAQCLKVADEFPFAEVRCGAKRDIVKLLFHSQLAISRLRNANGSEGNKAVMLDHRQHHEMEMEI